MKKRKISIVVPVFNERNILDLLYQRICAASEGWGIDWELLFVDDGSTDDTWEELNRLAKEDERLHLIGFSRNFGHQTAVSAGLMHCNGDAVVVMDADLQDPPEIISLFIEKWREGYQVVYAVRRNRKEGFVKRFCYWFFYRFLQSMTRSTIPLDSGDFCLMDRQVIDALNAMPERNRFVRGLRAWVGFKQIGLEYERQARTIGQSKYSLKKLLELAIDGVFSFSTKPLRMASYLGLIVSTLAVVGILYTLLQRVYSDYFASLGFGYVPGFATIVISILFFGGVQLICLGIIGEYLGRIYDEVKARPQWIVQRSHGVNNSQARTKE